MLVFWTDTHLDFGWECSFTKVTVFDPVNTKDERSGLWETDVVEMFIGSVTPFAASEARRQEIGLCFLISKILTRAASI